MAAALIDGKKIAANIRAGLKREIDGLRFAPGLGAVLVGDDPGSHIYIRRKEEACAEAGIRFTLRLFPAEAANEDVLAAVAAFNADREIDGILVQVPLPSQLDTDAIIAAIDPKKDADGFHPQNVAALLAGDPRIIPGLASGILELIRDTNTPLAGKTALIIANSTTFSRPLEKVLAGAGLAAKYARPDASRLTDLAQAADVLITAVGRPGFIRGETVKPGAIVIDVGITRVGTKVVGDVDAVSVAPVAGFLTPVPGGVGPMTIAMLLTNVVALAKARRG